MILARELAVVLDNLPESVELLACKFEFGDRPPVTVHIGDNADKIRTCIERQAVKANRLYPLNDIMRVGCDTFGISESTLRSGFRFKTIARAKQILCYLLRQHTALSLADIGAFIGYKDHTTALYHVQRVAELLYINDAQTKEHIAHIENTLHTLHPPLP